MNEAAKFVVRLTHSRDGYVEVLEGRFEDERRAQDMAERHIRGNPAMYSCVEVCKVNYELVALYDQQLIDNIGIEG